jgi:hypothetical protein
LSGFVSTFFWRRVYFRIPVECGDETVAAFGDGLNIPWSAGLVSQRFPQFLDGVIEALIKIDKRVGGPNALL